MMKQHVGRNDVEWWRQLSRSVLKCRNCVIRRSSTKVLNRCQEVAAAGDRRLKNAIYLCDHSFDVGSLRRAALARSYDRRMVRRNKDQSFPGSTEKEHSILFCLNGPIPQ